MFVGFIGAKLFGFNTSGNKLSLDLPGAKPKTSLGLVCGGLYGFIVADDSQLVLNLTVDHGALEDVERSLRYFCRHGVIIRFGDHAISSDCASCNLVVCRMLFFKIMFIAIWN